MHRIALTLVLIAVALPALAGGIAGTIRDAATGLPLANIDLDLFDATWTSVAGANAASDATGAYLISPLDAGQYYLRVDPGVDDGYVDQYFPGTFLKSAALPLTVDAFGTVIADFDLETGVVISGTITNAAGVPLDLIDLDVYAWDRSYISSINAKSDAAGQYVLGCFPPGTFYVKADPSPADFLVDRYYDGRAVLAGADPVVVAGFDATGVDFSLPAGGNITGTVRSAGTGLPLAGVDLDVFDIAGNFVPVEGAATDALGFYELGSLLPGTYYVQADAALPDLHVDTWFGDTYDAALATPVSVSAGFASAGNDINLPLGGTISGNLHTGIGGPAAGVDIDVFDAVTGVFLNSENAASDAAGNYQVGALPAGSYLVQADALPAQYLVDTYYGDTFDPALAQPVTVTAGLDRPYTDIVLPPGGTISGAVTRVADGLPVSGVHLSVFDAVTGGIIPGAGGDTDATGAFMAGAVPAGDYLLRCDGVSAEELAFAFWPGVTYKSQAGAIPVSLYGDTPGRDLSLARGGWITGSVHAATGGEPLAGIDLDVYSVLGEWVGALDFESDAAGVYLIGPVPAQTFVLKADPPAGSAYHYQYYDHTFSLPVAAPLAITAGSTQTLIDFDLYLISEVPAQAPPAVAGLRAAHPNPFNPKTTLSFGMAADGSARLAVYAANGRLVRTLAEGRFAKGEHPVSWDGRDDAGRELASGVYLVEFRTGELRETGKLVLLR